MKIISISIFIIVISTSPLFGNDGFFQGAGSTLIPVQNKSLRVITEHLNITYIDKEVSYSLLIDGKQIKPEYQGVFKSTATYAQIGPIVDSKDNISTVLIPRWHAYVEYEIEALKDLTDVVMGFPIPLWESEFTDSEGLQGISVPSVVNFKTYINGNRILKADLKWISGISNLISDQNKKTLAYIWKASFKKGRKYLLKTEYDFGEDYSVGFYPGREYNKGEVPWFVRKDGDNRSNGQAVEAATLIYYLTPLSLWANPPPSLITIKIVIPTDMPVTHVVPMYPKPTCIDQHAIYFEFKNKFPKQELRLSFPVSRDRKLLDLGRIKKLEEWQSWKKILGDQVKFTCALVQELIYTIQSDDVKKELKRIDCVKSYKR